MSARREQGQATVITVLFLVVLLCMAAAVLDVGSWFREQRATQATADAAALAGAQALPNDPGQAASLAIAYADKNGGGVSGADVSVTSKVGANDTIVVKAERPTPGFFAKIFGVDSVEVSATAKARSASPAAARWAAPIAVDVQHPLLSGSGCPCFNQETVLDVEKVGPGAFRLINLDDSHGGVGPSELGEWIQRGFDGYMPIDWYFSDPGFKPSSSSVKNALESRIGDVLLFPVYRETHEQGAGFEYHVIGWVGFHLTGIEIRGSNTGKLSGWFESITWEGIQSESAPSNPDLGVRVISLVE